MGTANCMCAVCLSLRQSHRKRKSDVSGLLRLAHEERKKHTCANVFVKLCQGRCVKSTQTNNWKSSRKKSAASLDRMPGHRQRAFVCVHVCVCWVGGLRGGLAWGSVWGVDCFMPGWTWKVECKRDRGRERMPICKRVHMHKKSDKSFFKWCHKIHE